ncbi:hypothetical protein EP073_12535 [Geovibrio thiophilus]|uniref:Porin n=1 Tax=Geovibrio thiophilus TaxID=139438 RepID=A0A410K1G1_9BACT|nr:hypothetical protein [Geovibrio thiophilus]QAR34201.1 hypothetical protein EP073_12535 [Geovibrio thiophilus]
MRKLLVVLMVVAFAATAFAADVKLSGYMEVKGIYVENGGINEDSLGENSWWEQDGNVQAKFIVDKGTAFTVRGDFHDGTWGDPEMKAKTTGEGEAGFTIQRAFLEHDFGKAGLLSAGLMATGGWGTAFGNNVEGNYRVKLAVPVAMGKLTFQTTKNAENGSYDVEDSEKDDNDGYGIDYVGKAGAFTYGANLTYGDNSAAIMDNDTDGVQTTGLDVMFNGDLGMFGFESELAYRNVSTDKQGDEDYDLFGAYVNGFANLGKTTAGLIFLYGSVDKDTGEAFNYADDFDTTFIVDELGGVTGGDDLGGFTTFKLYADYAHTDALTLGAAFAYAFSNYDDDNQPNYADINLYELDAYVSYQINKALNYTVKAAYLQVNEIGAGADQYDADPIYYASHMLSVGF